MKTTLLPEIQFYAENASPGEAGEDFVMPCSISQQRFWVLDQLASGNSAAVDRRRCGDSAQVQQRRQHVDVLHQALHAIVRRHEALRTSFAWIDDEVRQVISPDAQFRVQQKDLTVLPEDHRQEQLLLEMTAEAQRPMRLDKAPIFRVKLLRLEEEDHALLFTLHHIICDGWANGILVREIGVFYQAILEGRPAVLPELPIQYADYAVWQREWLETPDFQNQLAFWEKHLTGAAPMLDFPTDHPRQDGRVFPAFVESRLLPAYVTDKVKWICQDLDITLFMVFFAAFASILYRYTGQTRFIVGTTAANRPRPELENLIGQFANPMMLCADVTGEPTFRELLYRVRDLSLGTISGLSGVIGGMLMVQQQWNPGLAFAVSLAFGALFGCINGLLVTRLRIPSMIATLAMGPIALGANYAYDGGDSIYAAFPPGFYWISTGRLFGVVPVPIVIALVVVVACYVLLNRMRLGRL